MKQAGNRRISRLSCMCFFLVSALLVFAGPSDFLQSVQHAVYASSKAVQGQDKTTVVEPKETATNAKAYPEGPDGEAKKGREAHPLTRRNNTLKLLGWKPIQEEAGRLASQVLLLFSASFWTHQAETIWKSGGLAFLSLILLFAIMQFLLFRLRRHSIVYSQSPFWSDHPWLSVGIRLFYRSLPLLGTVLFLFACVEVRHVYSSLGIMQPALHALTIMLFSGWVCDFIKLWQNRTDAPLPQNLAARLLMLARAAGAFGVAYVIVASMLGSDSVILFVWRLALEVAFLFWTASFSKALPLKGAEVSQTRPPLFLRTGTLLVGFLYIVASVGFLVELAGYGRLALYWYASWGRTVVVLLWASILLFVLHKCHSDFADSLSNGNGSKITARPIKWLLIRFGWVVWLGAVIMLLLLAWGARQTVLLGFVQVLTRPIQVGSIRFSLVGFVYAFFILVITRTATRFWRHILERRLLVDSGLEAGVQQSVTSITVYLLWALGILIALTALGFSSTSLTVALGALGVGLGFGLQNIFNNFVSGLILLFERPVQVGDAIEVNGTWGTISKIKVRSTVVQTYDNASLIIPNADMISNQVTNWSFKDLRLRRWITVGVAYGSDTKVVRKTLLEIAHAEPKALKRPRPDVLFTDFGDSALIFSLRVWTTVNDFIAMETDIRFEIDRLFRERGIEIAFPQRDIHIRSVVEEAKDVSQLGRTSESSQEGGAT